MFLVWTNKLKRKIGHLQAKVEAQAEEFHNTIVGLHEDIEVIHWRNLNKQKANRIGYLQRKFSSKKQVRMRT